MPGARRRRWAAGLSKRMNRSLSRLDHHQERASGLARASRFREQREIFATSTAPARVTQVQTDWLLLLRRRFTVSDAFLMLVVRGAMNRSRLPLTEMWPLHASRIHHRSSTRLLKDQLPTSPPHLLVITYDDPIWCRDILATALALTTHPLTTVAQPPASSLSTRRCH